MPHITLEYSRNIEHELDFFQLLGDLHETLAKFDTFDRDRIKSRAIGYRDFIAGLNQTEFAFIHAKVSFSRGRDHELREQIGKRMLAIIESSVSDVGETIKIAKSIEIRQFEDGMYFRD